MIIPNILALAVRFDKIVEQSQFQSVGIMVVLGCLGLLAVILACSGKFAVSFNARKAAKAALAAQKSPVVPTAPTAAPVAASAQGISPELVAVISAAVHTALDGMGHRIVNIQQSQYSGYSTSGRTEIFASRKLH